MLLVIDNLQAHFLTILCTLNRKNIQKKFSNTQHCFPQAKKLTNQDRTKIVYIRARRPGNKQITDSLECAVSVIVQQIRNRVSASGEQPLACRAIHKCTCVVLRSVDSISVGRKGKHVSQPIELARKG